MTHIVPCQSELSDRFPVASFFVRVPRDRFFEVAFATDPDLFHPGARERRTARNFYTSRAAGLMRAPAGEATYLLPSEQIKRFSGSPRLYYAIATFGSPRGEDPWANVRLDELARAPFLRIARSFSGRALDRSRLMGMAPARDAYGSRAPTLTWGGDLLQARSAGTGDNYDDGYDPSLWQRATTTPATPSRPAPAAPRAHAYGDAPGNDSAPNDDHALWEPYPDAAYGAAESPGGAAENPGRAAENPGMHAEAYGSVLGAAEDDEEPGWADTREEGEAQALAENDVWALAEEDEPDVDDSRETMDDGEPYGTPNASMAPGRYDGWGAGAGNGSGNGYGDGNGWSDDDPAIDPREPEQDEPVAAHGLRAEVDEYEDGEEPDNLPLVDYGTWNENGSWAEGAHDWSQGMAADNEWDAALAADENAGDAETEPQVEDYDIDPGYAGYGGMDGADGSELFLPPQAAASPDQASYGRGPVRPTLAPAPAPVDPPDTVRLDPVGKAHLLYAVSELRGQERPFAACAHDPDHGLRYGLAGFDQRSGALGALLHRCREEDPDGFAEIYGDAWAALLDVTGAPTREARMAPVAGAALHEPAWVERFARAAEHRPFQRAQLKEAAARHVDPMLGTAARLGLFRDRALAALLDRCLVLGNAAGVAEIAEVVCPVKRAAVGAGDLHALDTSLGALGYGTGPMRARLAAFQADRGVGEDGRFGADTQIALVQALREQGHADLTPGAVAAALTTYGSHGRLADADNPYLRDRDYALSAYVG